MEDYRLLKTINDLIDKTNTQGKMITDLVELVNVLNGNIIDNTLRIALLENKLKEKE